MKNKILILLLVLINPLLVFSQQQLDPNKFVAEIFKTDQNTQDHSLVDSRVRNILKAFDKHFISMTGYEIDSSTRYTIIRGHNITIRKLVQREEAFEFIINDTTGVINWGPALWKGIKPDTTKLLESLTIRRDYELFYPNNQMPKIIYEVDPLMIVANTDLENILFFKQNFNEKLKHLTKKLSRNDRKYLFKYFNVAIDYFDFDEKKFQPKAIGITDITFTDDHLTYVGADIYGSHYLLTLDNQNNYKLISEQELWTY